MFVFGLRGVADAVDVDADADVDVGADVVGCWLLMLDVGVGVGKSITSLLIPPPLLPHPILS